MVVDAVLLYVAAQGTSDILMQTALAVVAECEKDLLALEDFEDILTFLKAHPPPHPPRSASCRPARLLARPPLRADTHLCLKKEQLLHFLQFAGCGRCE